eukprot:TRINITY_DN112951_c0_g1_i1.p1 TRINITY_DN112951_c0_g1~~TRINITY_DN112951_c0_g1_i1.p1  ORF type:complete len:459 (+),score=110.72 TRINITY_DN112951_c0_g1_i1:228-1604(+)
MANRHGPANTQARKQKALTAGRKEETPKVLAQQLRKTKLCLYYVKGMCQYGDLCDFAHHEQELEEFPDLTKTRMCKFAFDGGVCTIPDCSFAHSEEELRSTRLFYKKSLCIWHSKGKCRNGDQCRFAHGEGELQVSGPGQKISTAALLLQQQPGQVQGRAQPLIQASVEVSKKMPREQDRRHRGIQGATSVSTAASSGSSGGGDDSLDDSPVVVPPPGSMLPKPASLLSKTQLPRRIPMRSSDMGDYDRDLYSKMSSTAPAFVGAADPRGGYNCEPERVSCEGQDRPMSAAEMWLKTQLQETDKEAQALLQKYALVPDWDLERRGFPEELEGIGKRLNGFSERCKVLQEQLAGQAQAAAAYQAPAVLPQPRAPMGKSKVVAEERGDGYGGARDFEGAAASAAFPWKAHGDTVSLSAGALTGLLLEAEARALRAEAKAKAEEDARRSLERAMEAILLRV